MNCQKFETVAGELARGQVMEVELRDEAMTHSANCSQCALHLRDEEMLHRGLRSLATEMTSLEAPVSLEGNLLNAFRQQQVVVPMPVRKVYRRYWVAAVAALILVVFSVVAVRIMSEVKQSQPQQADYHSKEVAPNAPDPTPSSVPVVAKDETPRVDDFSHQFQPKRPRRQVGSGTNLARATPVGSRGNNPANHVTSEVATDFMPLGYLNMDSMQDGGQIVRVEVPQATLVKFGLPVNMDRSNERVKADLLVGMDGMAHAIRFVQERRTQ